MAAEELDRSGEGGEGGGRRRRRRRRKSRRGGPEGRESAGAPSELRYDEEEGGGRRGRGSRGGSDGGSAVALPNTGKLPRRRAAIFPPRGAAVSGVARRRRMTRSEIEALGEYLQKMPESLLAGLYAGLGGQPTRVNQRERMVQLAVRALSQGARLGVLVKALHQRDRAALAVLVQCGGLAQADELHQELILSLGGTDREWRKVMTTLGERGLVAASEEREGLFFYLIPNPLMDQLIEALRDELALSVFAHEDVRVVEPRAFCPPFSFSVTTLVTYIDQHPPRLTQRHEIFKVHKDEMDQFFQQIWTPDSELFSFHVEFLMMHGMVELKGDRLSVNRAVVEEWLQLEPEDQRDLAFASLEKRFHNAEWVMWAIFDAGGDWVPERPLQALYRRWKRGEDWRDRYHKGQWATPRTNERDAYSFAALVHCGMLELGTWGQEKFYRLTPRARDLLDPPADEGFTQFYLTPSFEIMAPAGMAPILFFRIGELAELTACDRANTYKITEVTIEQALEKGWRRDDILDFLRENSQIGLPENVEHTLRGWMGHHGDVEFHDCVLLTVHRSQIRRLEGHRKAKPYLLHRFVPGMYAVDRARMPELMAVLAEIGFAPAKQVRKYPDDPQSIDARDRLLVAVGDARTGREDTLERAHEADTQAEELHPIPGAGGQAKKAGKKKKDELPPRRSPREVRELCERAIALGTQLEILYVTRDQQRKLLRVAPERIAVNHEGQQVLVARDLARNERLSYQIIQIERLATVDGKG